MHNRVIATLCGQIIRQVGTDGASVTVWKSKADVLQDFRYTPSVVSKIEFVTVWRAEKQPKNHKK